MTQIIPTEKAARNKLLQPKSQNIEGIIKKDAQLTE